MLCDQFVGDKGPYVKSLLFLHKRLFNGDYRFPALKLVLGHR